MVSSYDELFQSKSFVQFLRICQFSEIKTFVSEISHSFLFIYFFFKYTVTCAFVSSFELRNEMQYITVRHSSH